MDMIHGEGSISKESKELGAMWGYNYKFYGR